MAPGAIELEIGGLATLELPDGVYDWTRFDIDFEVDGALDPKITIVPVRLTLVSAGSGEVFLDDLSVTVTRQ